MFQQYPQNNVNEPVRLYEGNFRVRRSEHVAEGTGSAALKWLPSPGIEMDIRITAPSSSVDFDSTVELPGFRTENPLVHSITYGPNGRIGACASLLESVDDCDLVSVGFQVVNFTNITTPGLSAVPGDPTTVTDAPGQTKRLLDLGGAVTCKTVRLGHDGWQVDLVEVPESADVNMSLKASGGYGFTHVGQLTRLDGSAFTTHQADAILESLTAFLSFAHGAACSLPIRWGRGTTGEVVWRQFGSPVVNRWTRSRTSWFDEHHGALLTELFDTFCRMYKDKTFREPLVVVLHWYRHCNTQSSGKEGSLVLGMAALDLLSALVVVDRCRSMPANRHDKLRAADKLRALLKALGVPADIPARYSSLAAFARQNDKADSCETLAEFRNGFVHPNEKRRNIVLRGDALASFEAWQLSLWYQELALLYLLDHQGQYRNRTTAAWVGQVEQVPWNRRSHPSLEDPPVPIICETTSLLSLV